MTFISRLLLIAGLAICVSPVPTPLHATAAAAQRAAPPASAVRSPVTVTVPQNDAEISVDGNPVAGTGASRSFQTPPLAKGATGSVTISVIWKPNAYTVMTRSRVVSFRAGEPVTVDLSAELPTDRVRVDYVPTPDDVANEMVALAGITANDVVYEPGCGDARITIAAVKAGAKKGVGIDIDEERVIESRANVKAAGLEDRVEIRLGDALDIRDLSDATVVFLYMGDHFNMLIRPILWKQLKVGTRVVSHRFKMGDWPPDKTVSVGGREGWDYELHLWTITEDVKRRLQ